MKHPMPAGFALLEVLVAMLLAAVAVLAMSAVHVAALHATRSNLHRVAAARLALDLGERVRANRPGALLGAGSPYQASLQWETGLLNASDPVASLCEGPGASCSAADFARADVAQQVLERGAGLERHAVRLAIVRHADQRGPREHELAGAARAGRPLTPCDGRHDARTRPKRGRAAGLRRA